MSAANTSPAARAASAWRSRAGWLVMLCTAIAAIAIDLASKHLAFAYVAPSPVIVDRKHVLEVSALDPRMVNSLIPRHDPVTVVPELLQFTLVLNPGAVFGIGPGQRWFFIAFTVVALGFGLLMFARWTAPRDHFAHTAIGLLIGGGLGNLYDRLTYGCVRDFIHPLPGWKWPGNMTVRGNAEIWPYVSNVADLLLLIGIGMLLVHLWRKDRAIPAPTAHEPRSPSPAAPSAPPDA
jgi:signal peptidase II